METDKLLKTFKHALLGFLVLLFSYSNAAENRKDSLQTNEWASITSLYIELGGKLIPSINIDFRKRENFAYSVGFSYWYESEEYKQSMFLPSINGYYLTGKRHRFEIGGGSGPFIGTHIGLASIMLFGNIGYRYQQRKGLIFRACFTPWMAIPVAESARFSALPWAGISVGYCF